MDKTIVTIAGAALIAFIYWFFFGKKEASMEPKQSWDIIVEGGYRPATITIPAGKTSTVTLLRKDPNSCLEEIVMPEFKIKKFLPINEKVTITLSPAKPGTYGIHCGMNMFHGKIVVVEAHHA
jgi:plastocyanin domain-containing protein